MSYPLAIEKAWSFLVKSQLPEGRFPDFMTYGADFSSPNLPDISIFSTCAVLAAIQNASLPGQEKLEQAALGYLEAQMGPHHSWSFWALENPLSGVIPTDLDDTAMASLLLNQSRRLTPRNFSWMLANRQKKGAFYTWVGPRWNPTAPCSWWRLVLRRFKRPRLCWIFWSKANCRYWDIDSVVNANVLYYFARLGRLDQVSGCVAYLKQLVEAGREHCSDKWYHGPWPFYYSLARAHRFGAHSLESVKDTCLSRILRAQKPDGSFGENPLETAQAVSALRFWNVQGAPIEAARHSLLLHQREDGSWVRLPFYFGGKARRACWGSESLTTALCLEALTL